MALPRPVLLALMGVVLSTLSFTVMRAIAANGGDDVSFPAPAAEVTPAPEGTAPVSARKPAAKPKPRPRPQLEGVPAAIASALYAKKAAVLLVSDGKSGDDAATWRNLKSLNGPKVATFKVGLEDFGKFDGLFVQAAVTQTPAVVIVRPDLKVVPAIEGYLDHGFIKQRVEDQLRRKPRAAASP